MDAFADDKTDVTQKLKFVSVRIENIVGKGENACYQHFLLKFSNNKSKILSFGKELKMLWCLWLEVELGTVHLVPTFGSSNDLPVVCMNTAGNHVTQRQQQ